jgi:hypothetical protein
VANSLGGYQYVETNQETGAKTYYFHDQPHLEDSRKVWKMTSDTFSATDNYQGDQTDWKMGMDVSGNALLHNLSADWINAGTISADRIGASSITAAKIASNAITADKINAGAVTAGKIAANAVTAEKINAGAVTAEKINAGAVNADKIASNAITAGKIAANAVTAEKLAANAITGKTITGGTITGATISGKTSITQQSDDNSEKVVIDGGEINVSSTNSKYNTKVDNGSINVSNGKTDADHSHTDIYPGILQLNAGEENCWIAAQLGRVLEISCKEINWIDTPMRGVLSDDVYAYGVPYTGRATISVNSASTGSKTSTALYILNGLVCSVYQ